MSKQVEYKIHEVTRYQVIRHESSDTCGSSECFGEFSSRETAERIAERFGALESFYAEESPA